MELPKRIDNDITETASFKIFSRNIPNSWIIREVSERDYGIDCYVELVDGKNQVTGELISIQLKGINNLVWTKNKTYNFSGAKISTVNYWKKFPTPVMLCVVDITNELVYFEPVKNAIKKSFFKYKKQENFSFTINKKNELNIKNLQPFLLSYFQEKNFVLADQNIVTFISMYRSYGDFFDENSGNDHFLGVELHRVLSLKHIFNNLNILCDFFDLEWDLDKFDSYLTESQKIFGNNYSLYEYHINSVVEKLRQKLLPVLLAIRKHITETEREYWISTNLPLFNIMINITDDGTFPYDF